MAFDLKRWQSQVRAWWEEYGPRIQAAPIESAYALLAASAWLPFLAAYVDDPGPAMAELVGITAGIGTNLVANVAQRIYDRARGGEQVTDQAHGDAQTRAELDAILQATQALEAAQEALGERWDDFARQLAQEMAALPGRSVLGAIVEGSIFTGDVTATDSVIVGRDYTHVETIQVGIPPAETREHVLRHRYLGELAAEANRLPWASLDPNYADPSRGERMGLADVYTALDTTELEHIEREDELRAFLARQTEARRIPTQEMIDREPRLLLLGDPGSGKSTLVNFLTYVLARAGRAKDPSPWLERLKPWSRESILPLRIILREFAANLPAESRRGKANLLLRHLETMLDEWGLTPFWPHLRRMLGERDQPILILLDGLDEVPTDLRRVVVESVDDFAGRYAWHRYLVTCRPYAYIGQPWRLNGFRQVTLAPFSEEQVAHFITAWYDELAHRGRFTRAQATARAGRLRTAATRTDLRGLAARPLLLTAMALLHTFRGQLPEDRVELYRWTVDLLLRRWEERVGDEHGLLEKLALPGLKMSDLEAGLYEIAFRAHLQQGEAKGTADITEGDLRNWLSPYLGGSWDRAGDFIDYIRERAGLLVRHKPAAYTFPHRTFQEYLAACHLTGRPDFPGEAARLARKDPDRWCVIYVLAAGHAARTHRLGSALSTVNALCPAPYVPDQDVGDEAWRAAILAGRTLLEIGLVGVQREPIGQAVLGRTQEWLVALLQTGALEPRERAEAGNVLAQLGDPRFRADAWYLPDEPLLGFVEIPEGPFVMGTREEDIPALLERFGGERGWYKREGPQHSISLQTYYIARYPVTVAQFRAFVEASRHQPEDAGSLRGPDNHPVVWVSWYEALRYCEWLTNELRKWEGTPEPLATLLREQAWVVTLPSEAEWEKAARCGDGRVFPWGDDPNPNRADYYDTGIGTTSAVGCFPGGASPCRVEDLSGNVWEWTRSLWREDGTSHDFGYPYNPSDGRENLATGSVVLRVLRGGAFLNDAWLVRCASRLRHYSGSRVRYYGFRAVLAPSVYL